MAIFKRKDDAVDMGESWQRMLDDSLKHHAVQREMSEKINYETEKFRWECIEMSAKENREKEGKIIERDERMIRIEAKLDELLVRGNNA